MHWPSILRIPPPSMPVRRAAALFKSSDSGGSWTAVNTGLTSADIRALAIDPSNPATLYAGTAGGGVFKSSNGGKNWAVANTGLTSTDIRALAIDPSNPATLYAGTAGGGVSRAATGPNVGRANTGLDQYRCPSLGDRSSRPGHALRWHVGRLLQIAINGGGSWTAINTGLTTPMSGPGHSLSSVRRGTGTAYSGTPERRFQDSHHWWGKLDGHQRRFDHHLCTSPGDRPFEPGHDLRRHTGRRRLQEHQGGGSSTNGGTWLLRPAPTLRASTAPSTRRTSRSPTSAQRPLSFTMKFLGHDQDGSGGPEQTFNLEPGNPSPISTCSARSSTRPPPSELSASRRTRLLSASSP